jgi:serine/threonine-protein kinase
VADELGMLQEALAGRYVVERELGRGGMGVVFLARDLTLERDVALKLLPTGLAAQPELRERFLREARTAAALSHPNIVPIHAVEAQNGFVYYAMGFVDGETLAERVRRVGPLPPADAGRILQEAAWALSYAHGRGVVHRDVKPDNILLERASGRALLTDFGIARSRAATPMTAVGEALGTPHFMSPEQAAGEPLDGRSDLYALGAVGFFALTGRPPFDAPTMQAVLAMHLTRPAPPVASVRAGIPAKLAAVIDRCLAKEPDARFATGEALVAALQQSQTPTAEIAPAVRGFQRAAELTTAQVMTLAAMLIALAELRFPTGVKVLGVFALFSAVSLTQLLSRARLLVRQGFTHADVRAAFAADAHERDLLAEAAGSTAARGGARWPRVIGAAGLALLLAGLAIGAPSAPGTPQNRAGWILVYVGAALVGIGAVSVASFHPRFGHRPQRLAGQLWSGAFGRAMFRLAGSGSPVPTRGGELATADDRTVSALHATLPADLRASLGDVRDVVRSLEDAAAAQARRERELDQAIADAAPTVVTRSAALTAGTTLGEQQARLVADLETARAAAGERRALALAALEGVRLQLLRVRSGLGTADDARREIEAARGVLGRVSGQV